MSFPERFQQQIKGLLSVYELLSSALPFRGLACEGGMEIDRQEVAETEIFLVLDCKIGNHQRDWLCLNSLEAGCQLGLPLRCR